MTPFSFRFVYCWLRAVSSALAAAFSFSVRAVAASRTVLSETLLLLEVRLCSWEIKLLNSLLSTSTTEALEEDEAVVVVVKMFSRFCRVLSSVEVSPLFAFWVRYSKSRNASRSWLMESTLAPHPESVATEAQMPLPPAGGMELWSTRWRV